MDDDSTASDIAKQVTIPDVDAPSMERCFTRHHRQVKCGFDNDQTSTSNTDDNLWDDEDLFPLLSSGVFLHDYVAADDILETQNYSDHSEQELMGYN